MPKRARRSFTRLLSRRQWRGVLAVVLALLILPYLLVPLYAVVDPVSTTMVWRWVTGQRVVRTYTPIRAMAPVVPLMVIVAEDSRFCQHWGIDFIEVRKALEDADGVDELRGASTISQQTAKNLFLWPSRSIVRKLLELPLALWLDFLLSKRRLLEIYLNVAEWGPNGEFGIEAGSRHAFRKSAAALTSRQAALLAAVLPNPHQRSAGRPGSVERRLARIYQRRAARSPDLAACIGATD